MIASILAVGTLLFFVGIAGYSMRRAVRRRRDAEQVRLAAAFKRHRDRG
jgi:hypothetical protein